MFQLLSEKLEYFIVVQITGTDEKEDCEGAFLLELS